jgi:hypothetical protein
MPVRRLAGGRDRGERPDLSSFPRVTADLIEYAATVVGNELPAVMKNKKAGARCSGWMRANVVSVTASDS